MTHSNPNQQCTEFDLCTTPLDGHTLIEANAGTGKTYTMSRIFIRLLLEKNFPATSILVVTFTEAASIELKDRIHQLLITCREVFETGSSDDPFLSVLLEKIDKPFALEQINQALHTFDNVAIHTIHGFCRTLLTSNPFECGVSFKTEIITNQSELIQEITHDFWRNHFYKQTSGFVTFIVNKKYNPLKLVGLWEIASRSATPIDIVPEVGVQVTDTHEQVFKRALTTIQQEWQQSRSDIANQLNSGSLKANIYSKSIIETILESMDQLSKTEPDMVSVPLPDCFEKCTTQKLERSLKKNATPLSHPFFEYCDLLQDASVQLSTSYDNNLLALQSMYIHFMRSELIRRKDTHSQLYFDDLLLKVDLSLRNDHSNQLINTLRKKYFAALIDEFQDTDEIQYRIFSTLFARSVVPLFLIGDPKQSIYRFRGADIFTYLKATQQIDSKYTLSRNYRSHPLLVQAVNTLFCQHNHLFIHDAITCQVSGSKCSNSDKVLKINGLEQVALQWVMIRPEEGTGSAALAEYCAQSTAERIAGLLFSKQETMIGSNRISAHHIAVLVRTNNQALLVNKYLSSMEIPSVIESSGNVFFTEEAGEILRVLNAIATPKRPDLIRSALPTSLFGLTINDLENLTSNPSDWEKVCIRFFNYHDYWNQNSISYMFRQLMHEEHVRPRILSHPGGERKLTNMLHLIELLHNREQSDNAGIHALVAWFTEKINSLTDHVPDDEMLRLESDSDCVSIVTVHKSKGLQFPVVFCPFTWYSMEPFRKGDPGYIVHSPDTNTPVLVLGSTEMEKNRILIETETLAEDMRLLYVALTRAESCCYAFWCAHQAAHGSAASYLLFSNGSENPPISVLKENMKQRTYDDIMQHLTDTYKHEHTLSFVSVFPSQQCTGEKEKHQTAVLNCRALKQPIPEPWKIASFSSLSKNHHETDTINDDPGSSQQPETAYETREQQFDSISQFPRGETAGLLLHALLEKIDLSTLEESLKSSHIKDLLRLYNFDLQWEKILMELLHTIATVSLPPSGIQLKTTQPVHCIKELQFHFPIDNLTTDRLKWALNSENPDLFAPPTLYTGEDLDFKNVRGFMKGFVDLLFTSQDTFYILDWKSNYLGNSTSDYTQDILLREMKSSQYILQYYIYTVAVNRFLTLRCADYTYEQNFGGVYYLFLRGLNPGETTGIYFDRPDFKLIVKLDELFSGTTEYALTKNKV